MSFPAVIGADAVLYAYTGSDSRRYPDYLDTATGRMLTVAPGGVYGVAVAPGRADGLPLPPGDGRWGPPAAQGTAPAWEPPAAPAGSTVPEDPADGGVDAVPDVFLPPPGGPEDAAQPPGDAPSAKE